MPHNVTFSFFVLFLFYFPKITKTNEYFHIQINNKLHTSAAVEKHSNVAGKSKHKFV